MQGRPACVPAFLHADMPLSERLEDGCLEAGEYVVECRDATFGRVPGGRMGKDDHVPLLHRTGAVDDIVVHDISGELGTFSPDSRIAVQNENVVGIARSDGLEICRLDVAEFAMFSSVTYFWRWSKVVVAVLTTEAVMTAAIARPEKSTR